ncbi:MAG: SPOR domain-containing protein [Pseudomonadota bacterium]|nr:SPOR domain-containing protein [Pseudomonadota bacterium]MDE3038013.1 SPOR domain-containing protein [Pseudomonadota bacterium]
MQEEDNVKDLIIVDDDNSSPTARWLPAAVVFAVVSGFVALAWYAYHAGMQSLKNDDLLVVEADKTPIKEKPSDPGGMQFPDQDKTIFETFNGAPVPPKVERVLPPPEEPAPADKGTAAWINNKLPDASEPSVPSAAVETKVAAAAEGKEAPSAAPGPQIITPMPVSAKPRAVPEKKPAEISHPVKKAPVAAGVQVQLGAYRSEREASDAWRAMQKKHAWLSSKDAVFIKANLGKRGVYYRLRLGGFSTNAEAGSFCKKLAASHQACIVPVH